MASMEPRAIARGNRKHKSDLSEGKKSALLEPFLNYARAAAAGRQRFVFTHSEIFPGTFSSTTETADCLIRELGLERTPVLRWGPRGMQQLSEVHSGALLILGFAGNSAPDHVDHFLQMLFEDSTADAGARKLVIVRTGKRPGRCQHAIRTAV